MHEYSVGQALMARIEQEAFARGATAVHRVWLKIGVQSGIEPELLASAFDLLKTRTICQAAALEIEQVPARWICAGCQADIPAGAVLRCGRCGAPARLAEGGEIVLARLEMEVP